MSRWNPLAEFYDPVKAGSIDGTDVVPHDKAIYRALEANYQPDPRIKTRPECTLFVSRLNLKTTESMLIDAFQKYGSICNCRLVTDIVTGQSRGYAFVTFASQSSADRACSDSQHMYLQDKKIVVEHELGRTLPGWVPRRQGGGFGGDRGSGQLRFGGVARPFRKPYVTESSSGKLQKHMHRDDY